jgi:hypothetical protein
MKKNFKLINQVINALQALEEKGCHRVTFEYGTNLFRVRIFKGKGEKKPENEVLYGYYQTADESTLTELLQQITNLQSKVFTTTYQCYRREDEKDKVSGEWEKCASSFEFGENATQSMLTDGSGYYIDDPDNRLQYFVDMKQSLNN